VCAPFERAQTGRRDRKQTMVIIQMADLCAQHELHKRECRGSVRSGQGAVPEPC
jgi:hypothetical protein